MNAISVDIFKMILKVYIKRKNLMVLLQSRSLNIMLSKTENFLNLKPNRPLKDLRMIRHVLMMLYDMGLSKHQSLFYADLCLAV